MECKDAGEKLWSFGEDAEKEKEREESGARGGGGNRSIAHSAVPCLPLLEDGSEGRCR